MPLPEGKENETRWIVFGDVDAHWVENMNSVMDDTTRRFPTASGFASPHVKLVVEVFDLQYAPATISRCGMVWSTRRIST